MSSGKIAEDPVWKSREQAAEAQYARAKEQEQLQAVRDSGLSAASSSSSSNAGSGPSGAKPDDASSETAHTSGRPADGADFEGGYGGQEELEDRYATTYGMH
ncbi:hypothetical protein C8Q79DRAFT_1009356 [Trametes meyenii]|nr:hypothetical protein C8Q79DRAFT_1009356 [Trametes meyenii]